MKQQLLSDFLGSLTIVNYIVAFVFVFLALIAKWTYKTLDGVKNSPKTPEKFSWAYWWKDNFYPKLVSLLSSIISVFIILRFSNDIIGQQFSYFLAIVIGFGLDYFIDKLKKMDPTLSKEIGLPVTATVEPTVTTQSIGEVKTLETNMVKANVQDAGTQPTDPNAPRPRVD
jgi:hypothetical protein